MADGVQAFPGEAVAWQAIEAAHINALRECGDVPPTPEQVFAAEAPAAEKPKPARKRGLDADARARLGKP